MSGTVIHYVPSATIAASEENGYIGERCATCEKTKDGVGRGMFV